MSNREVMSPNIEAIIKCCRVSFCICVCFHYFFIFLLCMQMDREFDERRFHASVERGLVEVRKVLESNRNPQYAADVQAREQRKNFASLTVVKGRPVCPHVTESREKYCL